MQSDHPNADTTEDAPAMAEIQKFLFERSFDEVDKPAEAEEAEAEEEAEEVVPTFSEEEMKSAQDKAFQAGKEEGVREESEATEQAIRESLATLAANFDDLFKAEEESQAALTDDAIAVAVSMVRKVFPTLNERHGLAEIDRMVTTAMDRILDDPKVVIYANPELIEPISERIDPIAAAVGYKGEVEVVGADVIDKGDCRVEWTGGGARRNMDEIWQEIDEIIERVLAGEDDLEAHAAAEAAAGDMEPAPEAKEIAPAPDTGDADTAPDVEPAADAAAGDQEPAPEAEEIAPAPDTGDADAAPDVEPAPGDTIVEDEPADASPPADPASEAAPEPPPDAAADPDRDEPAAAPDDGDADTETDPEDT